MFISTVTSLSISLWIWFLAGVSFFLGVPLGKRTGPRRGAIFCVVENWAKPVLGQRLKQSPNRLMRDAVYVSIFFLILIHRHLFYIFCICVLHLMPATVLTTNCSFFKNLLHVAWAVLLLPYLSFPIYETLYETLRATHLPASYRISHPPSHSPPHMTSLLPFVLCHLLYLLLHHFPPSPANLPQSPHLPFLRKLVICPHSYST